MANEIRARFVFDTKSADRDLKNLAGQSDKASGRIQGLGSTVTAVGAVVAGVATGAIALFARSAANAASRAQETQNLFDVSFGEMATSAEEWAQRTQAAVGVNDTTLKEFSGTLFNMVTSMGVARDGAFDMATGFTELALDASSFFNIPFEEAFNKIRAGLSGESEPLKQLGILVTENTILQTDFARSIEATGRELTEAEKVQARSIVIAEGLSNAAGDLIRTQDSWANQTRLVGEAFTDLQEEVGTFITDSPVLGGLVALITDTLRDMTTAIRENKDEINAFIADALDKLIDSAAGVLELLAELGRALETFGQIASFDPREALGFEGVESDLKTAGQDIEELGQRLSGFGDRLRGVADDLRSLGETDTPETLSDLEQNFEALSGQTGIASDAIREQAGATESAANAVQTYSNLLQTLTQNNMSATATTREFTSVAREGLSDLVGIMNSWIEKTEDADAAWRGLFDNVDTSIPPAVAGIGDLDSLTKETTNSTASYNDILNETSSLMRLFGVEADSTVGKILSFADQVLNAFNGILSLIGQLTGGLGGLGNLFGGGGGGGGLLGGLSGLFGGGGLLGLGIGGAIAGIGALSGLFSREGNAETTAESIGIDFDALSSDLQNQLQQVGEQVGDFATGIQLNIGEVISQLLAGGQISLDQGLEKIVDTLSFVERGQIDTATASQVLQDAIAQILPRMDELGAGGVEQLQRLIGASQAFGVEFDGLQEIIDFVNEKLGQTADTGQAAAEAAGNAIGSEIAAGAQSAGVSVEQLIESMKELRNLSGGLGSGAFPGGVPRSLPVTGAQHGFDGIVNRPRLFMAGEGNLAERVTVTPLSGGRGGSGGVNFAPVINIAVPPGTPESMAASIVDGMNRLLRNNPETQRLVRQLGGEG